ncbi:hypothetical protein EMCG_07120 [[Emmonsia] crescens]|uniref:Uncharacterized protein n=1 Tax=[Emmonsia] crescens TaxID=73230 RepID=A0A0G2IA83_9EURO|nr:hypothetical protein EMCG_07120 [Emmonsia crescens UAMH 3008]
MPGLSLSNPPRKRPRSEQYPNGLSQHQSKRQKPRNSPISQSSPGFWDNLSKIWLTKGALRELNRRNNQTALIPYDSRCRKLHRPLTRQLLAELKKTLRYTQYNPNFLHNCGPDILKDIKQFSRNGGPNLSDLRGYLEYTDSLEHTMNSSQSSSQGRKRPAPSLKSKETQSTEISKTTSTTAYKRNFEQKLIDHGVYPPEYEYPNGQIPPIPNNWGDINERLVRPRPSLSPSKFSDKEFKEFRKADAQASKEQPVMVSVIPIIEGKIHDAKCAGGGYSFGNLAPLTDGNLAAGKPDHFYGARPEQLDRNIRDELNDLIIPSTQHSLPMAPNFFLEAKGPDGSAAVARRQACYDGALGARGIQSLQSYRQDSPAYDHKAYTITSTYHDGTLKLYTSHCTKPTDSGNRPEYFMTQLNTWGMTGNADTFRHGATAYRNARDWAKETRDTLIEAANNRVPEVCTESQSFESSGNGEVSISTTGPVFVESDTSADKTDAEHVGAPQWSFTDCIEDEVEEGEDNTLEIDREQFKRQKVEGKKVARLIND